MVSRLRRPPEDKLLDGHIGLRDNCLFTRGGRRIIGV